MEIAIQGDVGKNKQSYMHLLCSCMVFIQFYCIETVKFPLKI